MKENSYQKRLIGRIEGLIPDSIVLKNDANYIQGIPDLLILHHDKWAALECKKDCKAPFRPNQEYYLNLMNKMSFARVIFPENEEAVLDALQRALGD